MSKFIDDLMAKMTLEEKIGQLNLQRPGGTPATGSFVNQNTEALIRAGRVGGISGGTPDSIPEMQKLAVENTRLGIPLIFYWNVIHGYKRVTLPLPLAMACTWDEQLQEGTTRLAAAEAAAEGFQWAAAPIADIARNFHWGRMAETFGADPYLAGKMTAASVRGFQGKDLSDPTTMIACLKHMAAYGASENGLDYDEVNIHPQIMHEVYLKPFREGVKAGARCVMMAFNAVAGRPVTASRAMIENVLRRGFGFKGFTVSDYDSVPEITRHGIGKESMTTLQYAAAQALKAGLDMELAGEAFLNELPALVRKGVVDPKLIDQACRRILEIKEELGLFKNPYRGMDAHFKKAVLDGLPAYREKAREAAAKSCVLMKNENKALPIREGERIALIGPLADDQHNILGTWSLAGRPEDSVSVLQGLKNVMGEKTVIDHVKGANLTDDPEAMKRAFVQGPAANIDKDTQGMIEKAVAAARKADRILLVMGEAKEMSGESSSKIDLRFPASQVRLYSALKKVAEETGKPLIVVGMSGRANDIAEELDGADAYVASFFAGHETGNGLADVLSGKRNFSGRLPIAWPRHPDQGQTHIGKRPSGRKLPDGVEWRKFHTGWLDCLPTPLRPLGFGLSYSEVEYGPVSVNKKNLSGDNDRLELSVEIHNKNGPACIENVQCYMLDSERSDISPYWETKKHKLVSLAPGERRTVTFEIEAKDLEYIAAETLSDYEEKWEGGEFVFGVGRNFADREIVAVRWEKPKKQLAFRFPDPD